MNIDIYVRKNLKSVEDMTNFIAWLAYPENTPDTNHAIARNRIRPSLENKRIKNRSSMNVREFIANQLADLLTDLISRSTIDIHQGRMIFRNPERASQFILKNNRWKFLTAEIKEKDQNEDGWTVVSRKVLTEPSGKKKVTSRK